MISLIKICASILCTLPLVACTPSVPDRIEENTENSGETNGKEEDKEELKMKMTVGTYSFEVEYESNKTAEAFKAILPATLQMEELNGNEKYCYISGSLPSAASNPGTINAGDIMLFGSNCVVVFYETFKTSYSYTRIGGIKDVTNLKKALGVGNVSVRFE